MENTQINIVEIISQAINSLITTLFSSIDGNVYSTLDDLTFINTDIINTNMFTSLFGFSINSGMVLIANSLLIAFLILYCVRLYGSAFINSQVETPYQFIFKFIIISICMNFSFFLCKQLININALISLAIREVGENIFDCNISFSELIHKVNSLLLFDFSNFNIFSFDGIIKSFVSINLFNLLFTYSLRYIMVKVLILISPFAILTLLNSSTSNFFKSWFKCLCSLLLLQSLISIILLVIFSLEVTSNDLFSKVVYIGSIYALTKANSYIKEIIGGISTDVSSNLNIVKSLFNSR